MCSVITVGSVHDRMYSTASLHHRAQNEWPTAYTDNTDLLYRGARQLASSLWYSDSHHGWAQQNLVPNIKKKITIVSIISNTSGITNLSILQEMCVCV